MIKNLDIITTLHIYSMTFSNIYEPTPEEVNVWAFDTSAEWPASDWDYYVMNGRNDELVFRLANKETCSKKEFFIHCLYYLVGDYFNAEKENIKKLHRIDNLINMVNSNSSDEVKQWKEKTLKLLAQEISFDPNFWFNYIYVS